VRKEEAPLLHSLMPLADTLTEEILGKDLIFHPLEIEAHRHRVMVEDLRQEGLLVSMIGMVTVDDMVEEVLHKVIIITEMDEEEDHLRGDNETIVGSPFGPLKKNKIG
jgi:hypothetical protein